MKQSRRGMSVIANLEVERPHDRLETRDIIGQLSRPHGRVLDERDWFRCAFASGQEGQSSFAHLPDEIHFGRLGADGGAQSELLRGKHCKTLANVVVKFDDQNCFPWYCV